MCRAMEEMRNEATRENALEIARRTVRPRLWLFP